MEFLQINVDDIWDEVKDTPLITNLYHEGFGEEECYYYLYDNYVFAAIDNEHQMIGFFSVEFLGEGDCETHAYIFPEHRTKSKEALTDMAKYLFGYFTRIYTTVTEDHKYIVRFLKSLRVNPYGCFKHIATDENALVKNGQSLKAYTLLLEVKE